MLKAITLAAVTALALTAVPQPASAGNNAGAVAAGIVGGLAVGAIIGSQANRNYYSGPGYYEPGRCGFTKRRLPHHSPPLRRPPRLRARQARARLRLTA